MKLHHKDTKGTKLKPIDQPRMDANKNKFSVPIRPTRHCKALHALAYCILGPHLTQAILTDMYSRKFASIRGLKFGFVLVSFVSLW